MPHQKLTGAGQESPSQRPFAEKRGKHCSGEKECHREKLRQAKEARVGKRSPSSRKELRTTGHPKRIHTKPKKKEKKPILRRGGDPNLEPAKRG